MQLRRLTRVDAFKTAALITKDEDDKPTFVTDDNHPYSALFSLRKTGSFRRNRFDYREKEQTADVFHGAINIYGLPMAVALDGCSELVAGEEIATLAVNIMNLLEELTHLLQGKELSKNDIRHIIREKYQQLDCLYQGKLSAEASFSAVAVYQDVNGLLRSIIFGIGGTLVSLDKGLNSEPVTLMLAKKTVVGSYLFEIEIKTVEENDRFILLMDDAKQSTKKAISFVDDITAGMMIVPTAKKQREMLCEICELQPLDACAQDDDEKTPADYASKEIADEQASKARASFLRDVKRLSHDQTGFALHKDATSLMSFQDPENDDEGRSWQFRIAIKTSSKNLKRAAMVLADVLSDKDYHFKCFIFGEASSDSAWDGTMIETLDTATDRDQRGKEFCVYMHYNAATDKYQRTPNEWKMIILACWKALQDAGVDMGYVPAPTGDKAIKVQGGLSSPFSYSSFKPYRERHGILDSETYNPCGYSDPLEDVIFTIDDLEQVGIEISQVKEMRRKRIAYLSDHLRAAKDEIANELGLYIRELARNPKLSSIDDLLWNFKSLLKQYDEAEDKKSLFGEIKNIIDELASRFPRVAKTYLQQHDIINYFVNLSDDEIKKLGVETIVRQLLDGLGKKAEQSDTTEKYEELLNQATAAAKDENEAYNNIDIVIAMLRIEATNEMQLTKLEMNKKLSYLQSFFTGTVDDRAAKNKDKGKEKESAGREQGESSVPHHFDFTAMVSANTPKMQLCYRRLVHLEREERAYNREFNKLLVSEVKERRKNEIITFMEEKTGDDEALVDFLKDYHLADKQAALKDLETKAPKPCQKDPAYDRWLGLLKKQCDIPTKSKELKDVATNLHTSLKQYRRERQPRAESRAFFWFRRDNVTLTRKKFDHAADIMRQLDNFLKKIDASLEFATEASLNRLTQQLAEIMAAEIQQNRTNEYAHWKFHAWLPTSSKLETVLEDGRRAVDGLREDVPEGGLVMVAVSA